MTRTTQTHLPPNLKFDTLQVSIPYAIPNTSESIVTKEMRLAKNLEMSDTYRAQRLSTQTNALSCTQWASAALPVPVREKQ